MSGGAELGRGPGDMARAQSIPQGQASCPTASASTAPGLEVHTPALTSPSVSLLSPCHINYHLPCQGQKTTFTALVLIKKSDFPILAA